MIELKRNAAGNYTASVTDTNGVLSAYNFTANSGNGVTFTRKGNTLTITATAAAAKNLLGEKTYSATGSAFEMNPDEAVLCWYDRTGRYQAMASYTGVGRDPLRVYIKIRAVEEKGSLTINKVDAETGKALAGVTYRLYDSAGKKVTDVTTGADGKAVFKDLPQGKYSYQEISAPSGYVVDGKKYTVTISATALNITQKRTNTPAKASIEIVKVDGDNKTPLQGAGFRLYDASGKQAAEGYTDVNGTLDEGDIHDTIISAMNELFQMQAARDAVKASISAVLAGEEQPLSLPAVELQIRNLQERQLELFQLIVSAGADCTDYDEELQQVNMAKTSLMAKKAELEKEQRGAAAFEERLDELNMVLDQTCGTLADFDELTVRQLVSNIKVLDKDSLLICFKDGTEITQAMQRRQTA